MLERWRDGGPEVSQLITDAIVMLLWLPLILVLAGVGIAAIGLGYRAARYGEYPALMGFAEAVDPTLVVIGIGGGVAYLYLVLANITFGTSNVEAAADQANNFQDGNDDS